MSNVPVLKPQQVVRILEKLGFVEVYQKDGRCTTVPFHKGREISPRLLRQIASDINLTVEEMLEL